jgi:hypothetical protein
MAITSTSGNGSICSFKIRDGTEVEDIFENNVTHSFDMIQNKGESFHPTVFVITEKSLYYCALDTVLADRTNTSPNDQVVGLLENFQKEKGKFGEIKAYHAISEAWMKVFTKGTDMSNLRYGDLSRMAKRIEVLTSVAVVKNGKKDFKTWEIVRTEPEIENSKVIEFKRFNEKGTWGSDKFPNIPVRGSS